MTSYTVAYDELSPGEIFWRDHYDLFRNHGYTLRRRYEPDWTPSWIDGSKEMRFCEDSVFPGLSSLMDATREDGTFVMLKKLDTTSPFTAHEIAVGKLFSTPELSADPRNHCVPILDVILPEEGSQYTFIVMPLLYFTNLVPFETVGEAVEYTRQIFEGLQFMHQSNVSHADFKSDNIMADVMHSFQHPPHPLKPIMRRDCRRYLSSHISRTSRPVKHYIIDFGLSKIYREGEPRLMIPPWGGDRTVPEHLTPDAPPCNPFLVDVYCAGNIIRQEFLDGYPAINRPPMQGLEFMRELISDMTNKTPENRPSMDEVVVRFTAIVNGLSPWTLRSPLLPVGDKLSLFSWLAHWTKQMVYYLWRVPPIPTP